MWLQTSKLLAVKKLFYFISRTWFCTILWLLNVELVSRILGSVQALYTGSSMPWKQFCDSVFFFHDYIVRHLNM